MPLFCETTVQNQGRLCAKIVDRQVKHALLGDAQVHDLVEDELDHRAHELRRRTIADGAQRLEAALLQLLGRVMHPILPRSLQAVNGLADSVDRDATVPQNRESTLGLHLDGNTSVNRWTS